MILKKFANAAQIFPCSFVNINSDNPPPLNDKDVLICVFDKTKSKSAFEKQLELTPYANRSYVRIDRPQTFMLSDEASEAAWQVIEDLGKTVNSVIFKTDSLELTWGNVVELLEFSKENKVYRLTDMSGKEIEVRPAHIEAMHIPSLTYQDLLTLAISKEVFGISRMQVLG